jgi:GAF domain-containing protein
MGAEDYLLKPFEPTLLRARIKVTLEKNQLNEQLADYLQRFIDEKKRAEDLAHVVVPTGVAFSGERDFNRLLEKIVLQAMSFCNADAGTLYLRNKEDKLEFVVVRNNLIYIRMGGTSGEEVSFPPLPMYHPKTGEPNHKNIVTHVALTGAPVNIPDAYKVEAFDFSGTKEFDSETGYRSTSFLTIPLKNSKNYVVGVLQLINAQGRELGHIIPFSRHQEEMVASMALLAAIAIEAFAREQQLKLDIKQLRARLEEAQKD